VADLSVDVRMARSASAGDRRDLSLRRLQIAWLKAEANRLLKRLKAEANKLKKM
jgi:hypothetical protein